MKKTNNEAKDPYESVNRRLDALIRITIETLYENKKQLDIKTAVKILHSVKLTPTEIATILGKNGPTAISTYLYSKPNIKKKKEKESSVTKDDKDE